MAGKDDGVVGKGEEFALDAVEQFGEGAIAWVDVGAADATLEKGVAGEDLLVGFAIETAAAGGVSGCRKNAQGKSSDPDGFVGLEEMRHLEAVGDARKAEEGCRTLYLGWEEGIGLHGPWLNAVAREHVLIAKLMVEVEVRIEKAADTKLVARDVIIDATALLGSQHASINNDGFASIVVEDISIFPKGIIDQETEHVFCL